MSSINLKRVFFGVYLVCVFVLFFLLIAKACHSAELTNQHIDKVVSGSTCYLSFVGSSTNYTFNCNGLDMAKTALAYDVPVTVDYTGTAISLLHLNAWEASPGFASASVSNATLNLDSQSFADAFEPILYGFAGIICAGMVFFTILISIKGRT